MAEEKLPVRLNLNDIAVFQEIPRRDLWTDANELAVDKRSVDGLAVPDVDVVDGWFIDNHVEFTVIS